MELFHTDNGAFTSANIMDSSFHSKQSIRFSGAGFVHRNCIPERNIKTICDIAQLLMINAAIYCSNANYTIHNQARVYPPDQEDPKIPSSHWKRKEIRIPFLPGIPLTNW